MDKKSLQLFITQAFLEYFLNLRKSKCAYPNNQFVQAARGAPRSSFKVRLSREVCMAKVVDFFIFRHFNSLKALQTWLPVRIYHSGKFTRYVFWRAAMPSYDISKTLKHSESPVAIAFSLVYFIFGFTPSPNPAIHAFNISHIVSNDAPASLQYCS